MPSLSPSRRRLLSHAAHCAALGAVPLVVAGCALRPDYDHDDSDAPQVSTERLAVPWGLVLGSGGPRGFVHVGVLLALEELKVKPPLIVGSSVGALVGALLAAGVLAKTMQKLAMEVSPLQFIQVAVTGNERFSGGAVANWVNAQLRAHCDDERIEKLATRFIPVATRLKDRKLVGFTKGNVGVAVQASAAIEGQFAPVRIRGDQYVDSDLLSPVPVRFALQAGAARVLSVDASAHEDHAPESAQRFRAGDLRKRELTQADVKFSDINLHPNFGYYVSLSQEFRERAIRAGYEETMKRAAQIHALASAA